MTDYSFFFNRPAAKVGEGPRHILLVENNPGDVRLVQESLRDNPTLCQVHVVVDGAEALAFLRRARSYQAAARPDLILLDLNTPGMSGFEALKEIKEDGDLSLIPVVIFTSSRNDSDIERCYELHVNSYIVKPCDISDYMHAIGTIATYWLRTAELPAQEPNR